MKQYLSKRMPLLLAFAIVLSMGCGIGSSAERKVTAKAEQIAGQTGTYKAYLGFQIYPSWGTRTEWTDNKQGITSTQIKIGKNTFDFNYLSDIVVQNKEFTGIRKAAFNDAVMSEDGTYTVSVSDFDMTSKEFLGMSTINYKRLFISTNIPLTEANVKCTDVKLYIDGNVAASLDEAKHNTEESTNGGCYSFELAEHWNEPHGIASEDLLNDELIDGGDTKNDEVVIDSKYICKNSIAIEYKITGVDWSNVQTVPLSVGAAEGQNVSCGEGIYEVVNRAVDDGTMGEVSMTGLTAKGKKLTSFTVPSYITVDGLKYKVILMDESVFRKNTKIKKVVLNDIVDTVDTAEFKGCKNLSSVVFGKNYRYIVDEAFSGCTSLKSITLPSKMKVVESKAFKDCKNLAKLTVNSKVKIRKNAFKGCKKTIKVSGKAADKKYAVSQIKKSGYSKVK